MKIGLLKITIINYPVIFFIFSVYGAGIKESSGTGLENSKSDSHIETSSQEIEIIALLIYMQFKVILEIFLAMGLKLSKDANP